MLFLELNSPDAILENINFQVLTAYCNMLHILRPAKAPGFAFAWLEIVSHRVFLGRILAQTAGQKGWPMFAQLLVDLFKFLSPFLRNAELAKPVHRKCIFLKILLRSLQNCLNIPLKFSHNSLNITWPQKSTQNQDRFPNPLKISI